MGERLSRGKERIRGGKKGARRENEGCGGRMRGAETKMGEMGGKGRKQLYYVYD